METTARQTPVPVASALPEQRQRFIQQVYLHLAGAILAFAAVESILIQLPGAKALAEAMTISGWSWLIVLAVFGGVATLADRWARSDASLGTQYLGLGLYVVAEAVIFLPLLMWASARGSDVIPTAGVMTALLAVGLTLVAFVSGVDFSFMRGALCLGGLIAFGLIVLGTIGFVNLGLWFSFAMAAFAGGCILYHTSEILRTYRTDQHVAASLALFASVALLFWYVVQIVASQED
jgi:FtsH-binding integral membrane protein